MEEERKAVIIVQQDKNIIDVSIAVFPGATSVGKCGDLAWIGFRAIKEELAKMPVNINDGVGKIIWLIKTATRSATSAEAMNHG